MSVLRERLLPLTGAIAAAVSAIAYMVAGLWLPHAVAVIAALATGAILTGAAAERGFARLCDARQPPDPDAPAESGASTRIGAAGTLGVALLLVARLELLSTIEPGWIAAALVSAAALSRAFAAVAAIGMPSTRRRSRLADFIVALALGLAPVVALASWSGETATLARAGAFALVAAAIARRYARRRLDSRRDTALAAIAPVVEIAFLAGLLAGLPVPADPESEA